MKIVIDIFESTYTDALSGKINLRQAGQLCDAIKEGTPLPKGHGDLIDRDELKSAMPTPIEDEYKTAYRIIDNAHAVIPSDWGNNEE